MSKAISLADINEHIEKVYHLLKKHNYTPQTTVLTMLERKKLWEFFFTFDEKGKKISKFGEYDNFKSQEAVDKLNKEVFVNADEETRTIIVKCGVDPKKVCYFHKSGYFNINYAQINDHLFDSMHALSIAKVGNYTIKFTRDHPIDRESPQIKRLVEYAQQEEFEKFKDGEPTFRVFSEVDGKKKEIYYHEDEIYLGRFTSFMSVQIGGMPSIRGLSFSGSSGMMKKDEAIANCINDLMPFFESFEELLSQG